MKRHKGKPRFVRQRLLIMCEGQTEKRYFQVIKEDHRFRQTLSAVHPEIVAARHPDPLQVVREAQMRVKKASVEDNAYDAVWVVFDHDNHPLRVQAYDEAISNGYLAAFSALAFEVWYLLHFVKTTRSYTASSDLLQALKTHWPGYEKAKQNDFEKLKPRMAEAFENAEWLRLQVADAEKQPTRQAVWTDVDVLVRKLISM